jgi:hypothetical protein
MHGFARGERSRSSCAATQDADPGSRPRLTTLGSEQAAKALLNTAAAAAACHHPYRAHRAHPRPHPCAERVPEPSSHNCRTRWSKSAWYMSCW